jgi:hypothetical protein
VLPRPVVGQSCLSGFWAGVRAQCAIDCQEKESDYQPHIGVSCRLFKGTTNRKSCFHGFASGSSFASKGDSDASESCTSPVLEGPGSGSILDGEPREDEILPEPPIFAHSTTTNRAPPKLDYLPPTIDPLLGNETVENDQADVSNTIHLETSLGNIDLVLRSGEDLTEAVNRLCVSYLDEASDISECEDEVLDEAEWHLSSRSALSSTLVT